MIRDNEIKRLVLYFKACGMKVQIRDYNIEESGSFDEDAKTVYVNKRYHRSKTEVILTLLHEASHVKYSALFPDDPFEGIDYDADGEYVKVSKAVRKKALNYEVESYKLIPELIAELDIRIPEHKVNIAIELDTWVYEQWSVAGKWPTRLETRAKNKQLVEKYNE